MSVFNNLVVSHTQVNNGSLDIFYVAAPTVNPIIITGIGVTSNDSGSGLDYAIAGSDDNVGTNSYNIFSHADPLIQNGSFDFPVTNGHSIFFNRNYFKFGTLADAGTVSTFYINYREFSPNSNLILNNFKTLYLGAQAINSEVTVLTGPSTGAYVVKSIFLSVTVDAVLKTAAFQVRSSSGTAPWGNYYYTNTLQYNTEELVGENPVTLTSNMSLILKTGANANYNTIITYTVVT